MAMNNPPERAVQCTGEFCRVAHQSTFIAKASIDEPALDGLDAPVHHVARCNAMSSSLRIVDGDLCDTLDRWGGIDGSVFMQQTTVTMIGVFTQANVTGDINRGEELTDFFDCKDDGACWVICRSPSAILQRGESVI
jgi:hypothetical protein